MRHFIALLVFGTVLLFSAATTAKDTKATGAVEQSGETANADDLGESEDSERAGLHWLDWLLIGIYGGATIALGWYFSRRPAVQPASTG